MEASQINYNQNCFIIQSFFIKELTRKYEETEHIYEGKFFPFIDKKGKRHLIAANESVYFSKLDALKQLEDDLCFYLEYTRKEINEIEKEIYY